MRSLIIPMLLLTLGCSGHTATAQTGFDYLDEARDRVSLGHRKLTIEAIDNAEAWFRRELEEPTPAPDPDPDPDPDPPVSEIFPVWSRSNPGYFLLDKVDGSVDYTLLDDPKVVGLSVRARWSGLNPMDGVYVFDLIDKISEQARRRGKWWSLRIMAGTNAPKWLDCPTYSDGDGTIPLPWCPEHKSQFDKLMLALGMKYRDDPYLAMVHVPGFNESAEMHMPGGRTWPTDEMTEAWEQRIDITAAAFPRQLVCLNHSPEPWSPAVRQWMQRLGKQKACFQMNALKGATNISWTGYTTLQSLDESGWNVGFQMVGTGDRVAPIDVAFEKGANAGARWYEVYQKEIGDIP